MLECLAVFGEGQAVRCAAAFLHACHLLLANALPIYQNEPIAHDGRRRLCNKCKHNDTSPYGHLLDARVKMYLYVTRNSRGKKLLNRQLLTFIRKRYLHAVASIPPEIFFL